MSVPRSLKARRRRKRFSGKAHRAKNKNSNKKAS